MFYLINQQPFDLHFLTLKYSYEDNTVLAV